MNATMKPVEKTIQLGKVDGYGNGRRSCAAQLELRIGETTRDAMTIDLEPIGAGTPTLAIGGTIWNSGHTDCISAGQNIDEMRRHFRTGHVRRIIDIWERWHLNDMRPGTRAQMEYLAGWRKTNEVDRLNSYDQACEALKAAGLLVDRGYRYGSAWLVEPIPADVLAEIRALFGVDEAESAD